MEQRRTSAWAQLADSMQSPAVADVIGSWRSWLQSAPAADDAFDVHSADELLLGAVVRRRLRRAHRSLVDAGRHIKPDTPADRVHHLRIDAKTLRYLIKGFGALIADPPRRLFNRRLKSLQDVLGEHQDAEMQVHNLGRVAHDLHHAGAGVNTMVAIGRLVEATEARRLRARLLFADRFAAYDSDSTNDALNDALRSLKRSP
jgi:CHAD domain-containing protein